MNKSFRNRMGGVMRRTSSVFTISRPNTPQSDGETPLPVGSPQQTLDTAVASSPPAEHLPSPIAESPAREAAALAPEPPGPSPLAADAVTAEPTSIEGVNESQTGQDAAPSATDAAAEPQSDVAAESNNANEGPAPTPAEETPDAAHTGFTDEPEEMQAGDQSSGPFEAAESIAPTEDASAAPETTSRTINPGAFTDDLTEVPQSQTIEPEASAFAPSKPEEPVHESAPVPQVITKAQEAAAARMPQPSLSDPAPSYFEMPGPVVDAPTPRTAFQRSLIDNPWGGDEYAYPDTTPMASGMPYAGGANANAQQSVAPKDSRTSLHSAGPPFPNPYDRVSAKASKASMASSVRGYRADQAKYVPPSVDTSYGQVPSKAPSVKIPIEDPFADPEPNTAVTERDYSHMPHAEPCADSFKDLQSPKDAHGDTPNPMVLPLPALSSIMAPRSLRNEHSGYSMGDLSKYPAGPNADETRPLLAGPAGATSYTQQSMSSRVPPVVSPNGSTWPAGAALPALHELGWIEYNLPDASVYYVHPTLRVTTDVDLRNAKKLDVLSAFLRRKEVSAPPGFEMWLRDAGSAKGSFTPVRCWVDHRKRYVTFEVPVAPSGSGKGNASKTTRVQEEDRLDMEYRYWSYLEAHPAHTSLPPNASMEAMDALTWSYTDRLLPSHGPLSSPFRQDECQELMTLLRSFSNPQAEGSLQSAVHTRVVSRILLRVAHWQQAHFRPHKALPRDAQKHGLRKTRLPIRRALLDFVVSCLCLGIPFAFIDRAHHHRGDEEGGMRGTGPMLVIGACTCLVAAIILSASVTLLSLPGLDNFARIAGFVAILCSTASMASAVISLLRYKAELERPTPTLGGEGMLILSRRTVMMSLPLVFLSYGIIAFIAGIVLYSFRGVLMVNPGVVAHRFDEYTRWTVVGALGGLAGMLTTSALLLTW